MGETSNRAVRIFLLGKRCTTAATPPLATNHMSMTTVGPPIRFQREGICST
jgi:hypothetical protein